MSRELIRAGADLANRPDSMPLSSTDELPGYRIVDSLGLVRGNTIRTRHVGLDILAGVKTLFGGEISEYTKMMAESREQSLDRMRAHAAELGANAVIGVRFTTSTVLQGAAEILVYGTAVTVERLPPSEG